MTFVSGFYSFQIELSNTDKEQYASLRLKVPRHPDETDAFILARILSYSEEYEEGLTFSRGLFEPKEPTIWKHSVIEELLVWCEVGLPPLEKLQRALRHHPEAKFSIYFYSQEHVDGFCYYLRGSKSNWVKDINFYLIDELFLNNLSEKLRTSNRWQLAINEGIVFLNVGEITLETTVENIDIWAKYQLSLEGT